MTLPCLGGGELYGDKLVRLVYVDEAGISDKAQERYAVVAGVIVDVDKKLVQLRAELGKIVEKHIPQAQRPGFVLHAKEIFNGGKTLNREDWPLARRLAIADDIAKLPRKLQLPVVCGWVDKTLFQGTVDESSSRREKNTDAHVLAYLRCAWQVDRYLRNKTSDEHCIMVVEDNEEARLIIRAAQAAFQDEAVLMPSPEERQHFPLRRVQEDPLFQTKRPASALELADFCAFIFKRFLMDRDAEERVQRFWRPMQGLAHYYEPGSGRLVTS